MKLFVDCYLGKARFNAGRAARMAGYSSNAAKQQGYNLLQRADVKRLIDRRLQKEAMSADEALARLSQQARATLEPFLYDDYEDDELMPRGTLKLDTPEARENVHLLKSCENVETEIDGGKRVKTKVTLHDSQVALIQILRLHGAFKDSGQVPPDFDLSKLSARQLERLRAGENLLRILLTPDGPDVDSADEGGEVEDDLPPA